jgi:hypothetical protein
VAAIASRMTADVPEVEDVDGRHPIAVRGGSEEWGWWRIATHGDSDATARPTSIGTAGWHDRARPGGPPDVQPGATGSDRWQP